MADEPRRSGRATKGQHKNASTSPAPTAAPATKSGKSAKTKAARKSTDPSPAASQVENHDEDEEDEIRCICGDSNPKDKKAFIGCDDCGVWQHNVCMGMPDEDEDIPDSYLCEQCGPQDHGETLQALAKGEQIWETRKKIWQNSKKMSQNRKGKQGKAGWLKDDNVPPPGEEVPQLDGTSDPAPAPAQEKGSKRKREAASDEPAQDVKKEDDDEKPTRASRQDKRRKSSAPPDTETEMVEISSLPPDRQKIANALSKIISDEISNRSKVGAYRIPDGHTAKSLGERHATRIEYGLKMNHEGTTNPAYMAQFRMLNANLKKNKLLIERLLAGSLTADELSTMASAELASEELQKERSAMKEQLDRQAVAIEQEGPKYRRTHKGDELIEDENAQFNAIGKTESQPVRERASLGEEAGSPVEGGAGSPMQTDAPPLKVDARRQSSAGTMHERRTSSQQFDMNNIWAKTGAGSPTTTGPRPMQMPPRRRSSVPQQQQDGIKEDADVDRLLQDDEDDAYLPQETVGADGVVWRGKLIQSADGVEPTVNGRYVAGRDLTLTIAWDQLLPSSINIDGRLMISKAEEYLCSLQWSQNSDVSVLALTPYDDAEGFEKVFTYFKSRERYAVINKDKPGMVRDMYIIPVDKDQELPAHVNILEYNSLKTPREEKLLLASVVVGRAPPPAAEQGPASAEAAPAPTNGHHLPQHLRGGGPGPAGSPLNTGAGTFSPNNNTPQQQPPPQGYPVGSMPPNPYGPPQSPYTPQQHQQPHPNPLVNEILGPLQYAPTAQQIVGANPNIERQKLENLRRVLEEDPTTRTDLAKLAEKIGVGRE